MVDPQIISPFACPSVLDLLLLCPSIFLLYKTYNNQSLVPSHCSVVKIVEYSKHPTSYDLTLQLYSKREPTHSVSNQDNETNTYGVAKSWKHMVEIYLHYEMPWPLLNVFFTPCTPNWADCYCTFQSLLWSSNESFPKVISVDLIG